MGLQPISTHTKISDEYVIKIRCLRALPSRFAYKMNHIKISGEYVIKKRWWNIISENLF